MLNWQDLQIFLEVARAGRLTEAARRLNIDHSTVSRRIRRFEASLNTQLFERGTQGYQLAPAGKQLLLFAEEMARQAARHRTISATTTCRSAAISAWALPKALAPM